MIELRLYGSHDTTAWNQICRQTDNGHFMFHRAYMEYHKDRIQDASFVIEIKNKLIGIIPGSHNDTTWYSHQGLSFGGIVMPHKYNRITHYVNAYEQLHKTLQKMGYKEAFIKPIPWIYHQNPNENDLYCLSRLDIKQHQIELSSVINLQSDYATSEQRRRGKNRAIKHNLVICQSDDFHTFWVMLTNRLASKYDKEPVHTVNEIQYLSQQFPENIRLYVVKDARNTILAGVVLFSSPTVDHAQYISASAEGMDIGALDLLFISLIHDAKKANKHYFSFGISTEQGGEQLNLPLATFKEGFGARSIVHHKLIVGI